MKVLDEVKRHKNEVQTDIYSTTWGELINIYRDKELIIDPEYQRLFRWNSFQQTKLIESILLDIPLPPIFLAQNKDGKQEVIDGLQRISTVYKFFSKSLFKEVDASQIIGETQNNLQIPLVLEAGPILPDLKGFTVETLPEPLVIAIKRSRIQVIVLKQESSVSARYEVFTRINTYGSPLTPQEVRNCSARIFGPAFPNALSELGRSQPIVDCLDFSESAVQRKQVEELILRLLAFNYSKESLEHEIEGFLDDFMKYAASGHFSLDDSIKERIQKTFQAISAAMPDGEAFKYRKNSKPRGAFSTNIFDAVASGILANLENLPSSDKLREKIISLIESKELGLMVGAGSNSKKKLIGRVELGKAWFSK